jgi:hypothetical protein
MLYGVTFGMELLLQADRGVILFQPCQAFLNIDASTITGAVVPDLNAALDSPFYDSITEGNETLKSLDFANPIIINGDRSITFVLFPPFSSAAFGGTPTFILEVRGEVTQISNDDKPRFGKWVIR